MDMDLPHGPRHSTITKTSNGCWTCRLRRKKCDEKRPVCDTCAGLFITCHFNPEKPEWMDGGVKQEEMAERLKREVRENAYLRPRGVQLSGGRASVAEATTGELPRGVVTPKRHLLTATTDIQNVGIEQFPEASLIARPQRGADCTLVSKDARGSTPSIAFGRSDTVLLMFYLENLLPFLFPFYRPSILQGGKAWILEMMIKSPVLRQSTLCQSSYFFPLVRGAADRDVQERVLTQTREAFGVLRQALQVMNDSGVTEHLHGAVRIMASIMQVQRFEIAVMGFNNCQTHLNAALALFRQLLESPGVIQPTEPSSGFKAVINLLGPSSGILPTQCLQVPSAEQAAFHFSSTLLIFDDIIASTVLQEQPRLYEYHHSLLDNTDGNEPPINLEAVVGCQNWVLLQIGEIAVLDAWKQQCKRAGNLDVMELVHRAAAIKDTLEAHITRLENEPAIIPKEHSSLLDILAADNSQHLQKNAIQSSMVTSVWGHAALLYLSVVVSGWQPASVAVRYHVSRIFQLLTYSMSPPELLRTMVWPFCVAGCLVEPELEAPFRGMLEALQPPSIFGTLRSAMDIMENVWRNRSAEDATNRDLATCFRSHGDLVLLV